MTTNMAKNIVLHNALPIKSMVIWIDDHAAGGSLLVDQSCKTMESIRCRVKKTVETKVTFQSPGSIVRQVKTSQILEAEEQT